MTVWNKYEPTAARKHGKPGREIRPQSVTIDIHSHVAVPAAGAYVAQQNARVSPGLHTFQSPETAAVNAKQDEDMKARIVEFEPRLRNLDAMGIDMQVIKPPPGQCYYTLPVETGVKAAQIVNDGIAEYCAKKPDRLIPFGTVPLPHGEEAAKELERIKKLGFRGVQILTNIDGRELSDPVADPFWKKAEELGLLVVIHPNGFTQGERFKRFYFNNVIGNPLETTIALHYLIFDGVLERHPKLKLLAVHGGGYLGGYYGRIDHVWGARSDAHADLPKPPTSYLRQIYVDTVVFSQGQLEALVKAFGPDHVVMGTDYPFDMADYDPVGHVASIDALDSATVGKIVGGNTKRILGLE
jgi:aminocarboxymuconate-semialdehyde decarboxylase